MVDPECLKHSLTEDEREAFERDGFVLLPAVLSPEQLATYRRLADAADADWRAVAAPSPYAFLNLHDLVGRDEAWLELVDNPLTLPKVWGVLGWNIQLFHTQLVVTPTAHPDAPRGGYGWHQDNNRMNRDFELPGEHPRVSVKIGYFLTDCLEPGMGNLCVVPGSQRSQRLERRPDGKPPGAVELTLGAGDAVLFDRRIWHSASANHSPVTRRVLFYGYSYRWLRPKSAMDLPELLQRVDPIRRQLLGGATSANGYFDPTDDDVPLRTFLIQHLGPDAVPA